MPNPLKFLFIVGCLEPGFDGVGDYTKTLADHLCKKGHSCLILAIKDPFVLKNSLQIPAFQKASCFTIRFKDVKENKAQLNAIIKQFKPDCISLQFVPYAFDKRGLPFYLARLLKPFTKASTLHIMMHEIWIGFDAWSSFKDRLIGKIQRLCIQYILKTLKPQCLHTHASVYQKHLQALDPKVKLLPLFGSIENTGSKNSLDAFQALIFEKGFDFKAADRSSYWIFTFFGAIYPEWPSEPLMQYLTQAAKTYKKSILLLHFGHIGRGRTPWETLEKNYSSIFKFVRLGSLQAEQIALILNYVDFGVATSPLHLLEKSASAVTFLEWGLPLIVNRIESDAKLDNFFETRILKISTQDFLKRLGEVQRLPYSPKLEQTCMQFLNNLCYTKKYPFADENRD